MRDLLKTTIGLVLAVAVQASHAMTLFMSQDDDEGHAYIIANDAMLKDTDAKKIRKFLDKNAERGMPTAIYITSPGGFGELMGLYATSIVEPSKELYKRHKLFNILIINEECSSACVILMGNITRLRDSNSLKIMVHPDAKFGFHSPVTLQNGAVVSIKDQEERDERIRIQIGLLESAGVNVAWLREHEAMLRSPNMTFLSGARLCSDSAGVLPADACVMGVADLGQFARNQLNSAVLLAQSARRGGKPQSQMVNTEEVLLDRMSSRPAAAPAAARGRPAARPPAPPPAPRRP